MNGEAPIKKLGQHWLHDPDTLNAMCEAAQLDRQDVVLEVGPGLGTLTQLLVEHAKQVIAVEMDSRLAKNLADRIVAKNLQVVQQDILSFDLSSLPKNYKVVANIPYYLTNNLLRKLCESSNPPQMVALLVQKEVAERITAEPGDMSILSVSTQFYNTVSRGRIVPAELFTPPPKVDSQIVSLVRRSQPLFSDIDNKDFFRVVKASFSQRRKKIRSSLSAGLHISKSQAEELIADAKLSPNARPQELSLDQWHQLCVVVKEA